MGIFDEKPSNGLVRLYQQSAFDAVRHFIRMPKCAPSTRVAITKGIFNWFESDDMSASIMWLSGSVGAGKSVLARTIAEHFYERGELAGTFIFSSQTTSIYHCIDGDRLIPTLVYQLTQIFPEICDHVKAICEEDTSSIFGQSYHTQMERLFVKPLDNFIPKAASFYSRFRSLIWHEEIPERQNRPQLILIDGLDECQSLEIQCDLLRTIVSLVPQLPLPIRFLFITRPESHIKRVFENNMTFKNISMRRIDLDAEDPNCRYDIEQFILKGIHDIRANHLLRACLLPTWPSDADVTSLVAKSFPLFIYAAAALEYIKSPRQRPDERLQIVLGNLPTPAGDKPFARLDDLYSNVFLVVGEEDRDTLCCLFGILYLAAHDGYRHPHPSPVELEAIFDMRNGESVERLLEHLHSLVVLPADPNGQIRVLHTALFDYLLDRSRSGEFYVDLQRSHEILLRHYFLKQERLPCFEPT